MSRTSIARLLFVSLLPLMLGLSSGDPSALSFRLTRASEPYVEPVTGWMVENTASKLLGGGISGSASASPDEVRNYFSLVARALKSRQAANGGSTATAGAEGEAERLDAQLRMEAPRIEAAIQKAIALAAMRDGLDSSVSGIGFLFPPVIFRFESLPNLLVVSPRDRIERLTTVLLKPGMSVGQMGQLEDRVESGSLSALVTPIGGLGVYPSMVPESADPRWTLRTVAHEWTHQFLALRPLGWRYALGGEADSRMVTVNETVAEMVGTELGDQVYMELYPNADPEQAQPTPPVSAFRSEMRRIRTRVDSMLDAGEVTQAESFMEASREELAKQGFYIRKLNQAYFAFYGSYADDPSSAGGTGQEISARMHHLRASSASLGDFLWKASSAGSYSDFQRIAPRQ